MSRIKITATCPECDEEMFFYLGDFTGGDEPSVDISVFEQTEFECEKCHKKFYTGDIDLLGEDEI